MKRWRVSLTLQFPMLMTADIPPKEGSPFPERLKPIKRFTEITTIKLPEGNVYLTPYEPPSNFPRDPYQPSEFVRLILEREAEKAEDALSTSEDILERILDDFAFQLQYFVPVVDLQVIDVSPPLIIGQKREILQFAGQLNFPSAKFIMSLPMGTPIAVNKPSIRSDYKFKSERHRAAMRWYVKSLASPFEVDKFALLWIALETLCSDSEITVERPYIARCRHEIPKCPICGESTVKEVNGPTIKKYLEDICGVDTKSAIDLWIARQMFHGSNPLDNKSVSDLPKANLILRQAVLNVLKKYAGISPEQPPVFSSDVASISPQMMLRGTRELNSEDLM